jgi:hypothetical protein
VSQQKISLEGAGAQPNTRAIPGEMVAELMALGSHRSHEVFLTCYPFCNHEERRPSSLSP